ncbi:SelB C-terminal domain-containing protein [Micromonospora sp. M12]
MDEPVRLWVDRSFTVRGSGTVVTGTLGAGRLRVGDELELAGADDLVRVRGLHCLGEARPEAVAVAGWRSTCAVRPRPARPRRRAAHPGRFHRTDLVDVRLTGDPAADLPATLTLHVGSAAVPARVRPLGPDTVRLRLARPLPLLVGDRALLRDRAGTTSAAGAGAGRGTPPLARRVRPPAARRSSPSWTVAPTWRGVAPSSAGPGQCADPDGVPVHAAPVAGDWLADPAHWRRLGEQLTEEVARHAREHPLEPGCRWTRCVSASLCPTGCSSRRWSGRRCASTPGGSGWPAWTRCPSRWPGRAAGPRRVRQPAVSCPEADRLVDLGLGPREIGAAVRAGALLRLADNVVLLPDALDDAVRVLAGLPQPFTLSAARQALDTTRRVAVPLLELLDRRGVTRRLPDDARIVVT